MPTAQKKKRPLWKVRGHQLFGFLTIERKFTKNGAELRSTDVILLSDELPVNINPFYSDSVTAAEWSKALEEVTEQSADLSLPFADDLKEFGPYETMVFPIFIPTKYMKLYDALDKLVWPEHGNGDRLPQIVNLMSLRHSRQGMSEQFSMRQLMFAVCNEVCRIHTLIPKIIPHDKSELEMWGLL